jgi:nitroreductase
MRLLKTFMIILLVIAVLAVGLFVWDGAFLKTEYDPSQDQYDDEKELMSEIEFQLIRAGIQAASSHNMQPWKIRILDENTFSLCADMAKALPIVDPDNRQLLMSQGTFIGSVREAAKKSGVEIEVTYHPIRLEDERPLIATFKILGNQSAEWDVMAAATGGKNSAEQELAILKDTMRAQEIMSGYQTVWIDGTERLGFQDYLRKGTVVESGNQSAMVELLQIFRFTKWAKNHHRYGLSLNAMAPAIRIWIEPMIGLTSGWKGFGRSSITAFEQRLAHEDTYLVLAKRNPSASDYVQAGETLSALSLHAEGYRVWPAVQLLQPLDGMESIYQDLKNEYEINGEVLQIIGFTKRNAAYHESVRHQVLDLIISGSNETASE